PGDARLHQPAPPLAARRRARRGLRGRGLHAAAQAGGVRPLPGRARVPRSHAAGPHAGRSGGPGGPLTPGCEGIAAGVRATLTACLEGRELSVPEALGLTAVEGPELAALCAAADRLRRQQAGEAVSYVINRNINFTNVCVKACRFC